MAQTVFHPSVEGAQHGAKSLADFLSYAKKSGAAGAQPSNYMLQSDKGFKSAKEIKDTFSKAKMKPSRHSFTNILVTTALSFTIFKI